MSAAEHPRTAVPGQAKANTNTKSKPPAEAKGNRKGRAKEKTQGKTTAPTAGPVGAGRRGAERQAALGSAERRAAVVLEVLAGVRTVPQAAEALGVSVNYYYLLERQALAGLVAGCAPRPRGKPGTAPSGKWLGWRSNSHVASRNVSAKRHWCARRSAPVA